jgi:hypothetical protein
LSYMGNFVDKDVVKNKRLSIDPPTSAASLHQFLSQHAKTAGVKIEGAFTAPVLKVRTHESKKLDAESRKAWSFYLYNMQQRLVGTDHAVMARESIDALLKREPLKLSVGMLLGPLQHLMLAEQERLARANSYVRRWLANEKAVLHLAVPPDAGGQSREKENRDREALVTACTVLSRFSDCKDGEIDTDKIRREAYEIGHGLTEEECKAIGSARISLMSRQGTLGDYIGPEAQLLISLCLTARDKTERAFLSDDTTKGDVSNIATALRARTDNNEYAVPTSPRTIAERTVRRLSMPVFFAAETTATAASTISTASTSTASTTPARLTPEKENGETRTTPPSKSPPSTPRRDATDDDRSRASTPLSTSSSAQPVNTRYGGSGGAPLNLSAAINELKSKQRSESDPANGASSALHAVTPPVTPRRPFLPSSASTPSDSDASTAKTPKPHSSRKRLDKANRSDAVSPRQKSDGSETSSQRTRKPESSRRAKSMVFEQNGHSADLDSSDQKALVEAGNAARALTADLLKPRTDSAFSKKWDAAEQQLQSVLTVEASTAIRRLMPYCHEVNLAQGNGQASLERVIKYLKPMVKERNAYIAVRDILLAESRGEAKTNATTAFPELLSLLVFAIDADRARRQERAAKSSH